jgi:hypothetical protein
MRITRGFNPGSRVLSPAREGVLTVSRLVKRSRTRRKAWAAVPCRKVKLMKIAETVPIPHRRKSRTHSRESGIRGFYDCRIILEMDATLAARPGSAAALPGAPQLNGTKNFHVSMRYNVSPVMSKHNY